MMQSQSGPFQLHLPGFDGPVDELARRVEQRHLPPSQLPLTDITRQFSGYMESAETLDLAAVADFVSTVARLMLWKSRALLQEEETVAEDDAIPAEQRGRDEELIAGAHLLRMREGTEMFSAPPREMEKPREPYAPSLLHRAWSDIEERTHSAAVDVAVPAFVRLEVALSRIVRGLRSQGRLRFTRLLRGSSRGDVVMHFLALLELIRRGEAIVEQSQPFGDIECAPSRQDEPLASRIG